MENHREFDYPSGHTTRMRRSPKEHVFRSKARESSGPSAAAEDDDFWELDMLKKPDEMSGRSRGSSRRRKEHLEPTVMKAHRRGELNTPYFDKLSPRERKKFFATMNEARENVLQSMVEKEEEIQPLTQIMKLYKEKNTRSKKANKEKYIQVGDTKIRLADTVYLKRLSKEDRDKVMEQFEDILIEGRRVKHSRTPQSVSSSENEKPVQNVPYNLNDYDENLAEMFDDVTMTYKQEHTVLYTIEESAEEGKKDEGREARLNFTLTLNGDDEGCSKNWERERPRLMDMERGREMEVEREKEKGKKGGQEEKGGKETTKEREEELKVEGERKKADKVKQQKQEKEKVRERSKGRERTREEEQELESERETQRMFERAKQRRYESMRVREVASSQQKREVADLTMPKLKRLKHARVTDSVELWKMRKHSVLSEESETESDSDKDLGVVRIAESAIQMKKKRLSRRIWKGDETAAGKGTAGVQVQGAQDGASRTLLQVAQDGPARIQVQGAQDGAARTQPQEAQDGAARIQVQGAQDGAARTQAQEAQDGAARIQVQGAQDSPARIQVQGAQDGAARIQAQVAQDSPARIQAQVAQDSPARIQAQVAQDGPARIQAQGAQDGPARIQAQAAQDDAPDVIESSRKIRLARSESFLFTHHIVTSLLDSLLNDMFKSLDQKEAHRISNEEILIATHEFEIPGDRIKRENVGLIDGIQLIKLSKSSFERPDELIAIKDKRLKTPLTKIRILQDLLMDRAAFVVDSTDQLLIRWHPSEEYIPDDSFKKEDVFDLQIDGGTQVKTLGLCGRIFSWCCKGVEGDKVAKDALDSDQMHVEMSERDRDDPVSVTIDDDTMEVLRAVERKKMIAQHLQS